MPKKRGGYARPVLAERAKAAPIRRCVQCGTKLTKKEAKYCDQVCREEHNRALRLARRPETVACAYCGSAIDPLSREPYQLKDPSKVFCDQVCATGGKQQSGFYRRISAEGIATMQQYRQKHGQVQSYGKRAAAVSANNQLAPPKAKYFERTGQVYGYEVIFYPNEETGSYRAVLPELVEVVPPIVCQTKLAGLKALRAHFLEYRLTPKKRAQRAEVHLQEGGE